MLFSLVQQRILRNRKHYEMDRSHRAQSTGTDETVTMDATFARFSTHLDGSDRRVLSPVEPDETRAYFSTSHRVGDNDPTSPKSPPGALKKVANTQAFLRRARHRASGVGTIAQVGFDDEDEEEGGLISSKLMSRTQRKSVASVNKVQSGLFFDDDDDNDEAANDAAENAEPALPPAFDELLLDKPGGDDNQNPVVELQFPQTNVAKKSTKKIKMFQRLFDDANPERRLYLLPDEVLNAMHAFGANITEDALLGLLQEIDTSDSAKNYQFAASLQKSNRSRSITDQAVQQLSNVVDHLNHFIVNPAKNMLLRSAGNQGSGGGNRNQDSINAGFQAPRVFFEDFVSLMELWQTSARFQIFEERLSETEGRLDEVRHMKSLIPDGLMMWFWQCVMLIASFYLVISAVGSYVNNDNEVSSYLAMTTVTDGLVSIFLLIDLVVRMRTGIVAAPASEDLNDTTTSTFVDSPKEVLISYVTSAWFLLDLFCVVPFRFVVCVGGNSSFDLNVTALERNATIDISEYFLPTGCAPSASLLEFRHRVFVARLLSLTRALKFLETLWYFPETSVTPMTRIYIWRQYVIAEFLSTVAQFGVAVHILAVIHHNIQDTADLSSSSFHRYSQSMYTVLYCLATVGYGDVVPKTDNQRLFMMFLCILGMLFSGFVIGSIVSFLQSSDIEMDRQRKLVETSTLLEYFRVPTALREEVLSFQNYILQHSLMKTYDSVVEGLPADMQQNLDLWTRIQAVHTFPLLRNIHRSAKLSICNALVEITFCPEEYIYLFGENGEEMFFINHGFVDILDTRGVCIRTLKAGDYFGEGAVVEHPGNNVPRLDDAKEHHILRSLCPEPAGISQHHTKVPKV